MNYEQIVKEANKISAQICKLQKELTAYPEGKLLCVKNGKYVKWYKSNGAKPIYISKDDFQIVDKLALRKYYTMQLEELTKELELLEQYIKWMKKRKPYESLLLEESEIQKILSNYFNNTSNGFQEWTKSQFQQNTMYLEHLIYKTIAGFSVRSKSEVIIANTLYTNNIPFRYECALQLGEVTFFPDFTVLYPKTGKIIYWEHFGMMDNSSCCDNAYGKLRVYGTHQIIPTINLITTYEKKMIHLIQNKSKG